ncbi:Imm61 family immunity protein [Mycobacterium sp. pV006]|uniref:Imm61 family immunity protein n=1 Tax=Mycobacterium sp. pV006 TaxID=3238983 RepID=UPI00351B4D3B
MTTPHLSMDLVSWARRAGYAATADAVGALLYSAGGEHRYYVRQRQDDWFELDQASRVGKPRFKLRAKTMDTLERHLFAALGIIIRDDLGLPSLRIPHQPCDLAEGFTVSAMSADQFRTLSCVDAGPVAVAREETLSLLTLVPLSHFLRMTVRELEESFTSRSGSPLMSRWG